MAEKILLVNPRKTTRKPTKRGKTKMAATKRRRTAAQKAATRKLVAYNRSRRKAPSRRRRKNPMTTPARPRRANAYRRAIASYTPNPRRRRRRASPTVRRAYSRRRRNPTGGKFLNRLMPNLITPALTAGTGAILMDIGWAYLPIPAQYKTGYAKGLTKAGGAIAMSFIAEKIPGVSRQTAQSLGVGALTVAFYNMAKLFIAQQMPDVKMDGMGYYNPGYPAGPMPSASSPGITQQPSMGLYVGNTKQPTGTRPTEMGYYANQY